MLKQTSSHPMHLSRARTTLQSTAWPWANITALNSLHACGITDDGYKVDNQSLLAGNQQLLQSDACETSLEPQLAEEPPVLARLELVLKQRLGSLHTSVNRAQSSPPPGMKS